MMMVPIAVLAEVTLGKMLQPAAKADGDVQMLYLRAAHVQPNGRLDLEVEAKQMWFSPTEARQLDIRCGDVLVVEGGAAGRSAHLSQDMPGFGFQNALVRLRPSGSGDGRFLDYALRSSLNAGAIAAECSTVSMAHFTAEKVSRFRVPYHSLAEQRRIADYLDRETAQIDAMDAELDRLVETLRERVLSEMRRLTYVGGDGIDWDLAPMGLVFRQIGSGTTPNGDHYYTDDPSGIPWVTTSELRERVVTATKQRVTPLAATSLPSLTVHPEGSLAIAMYGATIGRLGMLGIPATTNQACCVFSDPDGVLPKFAYYALWAQRDDLILEAAGGGQPNISQGLMRRWRIPLPPPEEQQRIVAELDEQTARIDDMIADAQRLKALLAERRSTLITEVVTGRKEVPA